MAKKATSRKGDKTKRKQKTKKAVLFSEGMDAPVAASFTSAVAAEVFSRSAERYVRRAIWWALCGKREHPPIQPKIPEPEFNWLKPPSRHLDFGKQPMQPQTWSIAFDHILILLRADGLFPRDMRPNEAGYWFNPPLDELANHLVTKL